MATTPSSPSDGDEFVSGNRTFVYNAELGIWRVSRAASSRTIVQSSGGAQVVSSTDQLTRSVPGKLAYSKNDDALFVYDGFEYSDPVSGTKIVFPNYMYANVDETNPDQSINIGDLFGLDFALGGTRMFAAQRGYDFGFNWGFVQYDLSTPWDLSTATQTKTVRQIRNTPRDLTAVESGEYISIGNYNDSYDSYMIYKMSTPGEIDTISTHSRPRLVTFTGGNNEAFHDSIVFSNDGLNLYLGDRARDQVYHYILDNPFDISSFTFNHSFGFFNPDSVYLDKENGNHLYVNTNHYKMTTPFDMSTIEIVSTGNYNPGHVRVENDGAIFFTWDTLGNINKFIV